jgi:DNA-binding CsgD family transcriptional regulator
MPADALQPDPDRDLGPDPGAGASILWLTEQGQPQDAFPDARAWLATPGAGAKRDDQDVPVAVAAPALVAALLDEARVNGQALAVLGRADDLPATLCCRCAGTDLRLEIHAPECIEVDASLLQPPFQLTPAEAQVAALLCDGLSPAAIAAGLGVQVNTVLTHVKRALTKTGCRCQAHLVSLLLRSVVRRPRLLPKGPRKNGGARCCG